VALEIERKFLVDVNLLKKTSAWNVSDKLEVKQGFMTSGPNTAGAITRIRVTKNHTCSPKAFLTIKAASEGLLVRQEFEYEIPIADGNELLELCEHYISKERSILKIDQHLWEIDVFAGKNAGLVVAEVELKGAADVFEKPAWALEEVTDDPRYLNSCLSTKPFSEWNV